MKNKKKEKVEYKVLHEKENLEIDKLFKCYKKDPYLARVIFQNNTTQYEQQRLVVFKQKDGSFQIVLERKKFGISITNRMYSSVKRLMTISYKADKKQFWLINNVRGKQVLPLSVENLRRCPAIGFGGGYKVMLDYIEEKFSWLRFVREHEVLQHTPFNTIINHKLYNLKKALQYQYKVPAPVAKILHEARARHPQISGYMKYYLRWIKNIENFNAEWVAKSANGFGGLFYDTLKMAKTLDRQVNCSWSKKRLKEEHDKWSYDITEIIFTHGNRPMEVDEVYLKFAEWAGWKILTETKEMALEGRRMNHCVATYVSNVDSGSCGILHIEGHTLQLKRSYGNNGYKLYMGQFYGYGNEHPPKELKEMVSGKIDEYNDKIRGERPIKEDVEEIWVDEVEFELRDDDLPF
jgi:hypothetical protein